MWRIAWSIPVLLVPRRRRRNIPRLPLTRRLTPLNRVSYAIADWRRLKQSSGYSFADYARFLIANPDWPAESTMRLWAEKAMRPGENANTVLAFFAADPPTTGNGFARLADALAASGRTGEALAAARSAWGEPTSAAPTSRRCGRATARASPPRIAIAGSIPCCSPRSPMTPRVIIRWRARRVRRRSPRGSRCRPTLRTPRPSTRR